MTTWVVPGAALEYGAGWRIWYSTDGRDDFSASDPVVSRRGRTEPIDTSWQLLPRVNGLDRRMGVLEVRLRDLRPGALYDVAIPELGHAVLHLRSMPDSISAEGVEFLVASCFWRDADKGMFRAGLDELLRLHNRRPVFKLLVGDQVYADWPWRPPRPGAKGAVASVAARYAQYWGDHDYRAALQATANFFTCDDHEFWNDYPEIQIHLGQSYPPFRRAYSEAALRLYDAYQASMNPAGARWFEFSIGPVSFFVTDARSERNAVGRFSSSVGNAPEGTSGHFFQQEQWDALAQWASGLRGPGVLVLGQPLYQEDGDWKDHSLSNFADDYERLLGTIETALGGDGSGRDPHDVLVISGDIHTGRFVRRLPPPRLDAPEGVIELIASPSSMIEPGSKRPSLPPDHVPPSGRRGRVRWRPPQPDAVCASIADNLAHVRMEAGTNGRVRFRMTVYAIRDRDERSWWDRLRGRDAPELRVREAFKPIEVQLR